MRSIPKCFAALLLLRVAAFAAEAQPEPEAEPQPPYLGEVTGERVYIRAGDGVNYTVLGVAQRGDQVEVKERRFDWLRVSVPEKCTLWVFKDLLSPDAEEKQATVAKDNVNVRARPTLKGDIMGQLEKGSTVAIVDKDGDWVGIAPPPAASAWVHKEFVKKVGEAGTKPVAEPKTAKGMAAAAGAELLKKAQDLYKSELAKPSGERKFDEVIGLYQEVASKCDDAAMASRAERARQRLLKIVDLLQSLKAAREPIDQFDKKYKDLETEYKRRADEAAGAKPE